MPIAALIIITSLCVNVTTNESTQLSILVAIGRMHAVRNQAQSLSTLPRNRRAIVDGTKLTAMLSVTSSAHSGSTGSRNNLSERNRRYANGSNCTIRETFRSTAISLLTTALLGSGLSIG